jgi:phosphocarrier protein
LARSRTARGAHSAVLRICNKRGLHARASAKFVHCVAAFDAEVSVSKDGVTVGGTSIMGLMTLVAANGSEVEVKARGRQAAEVIEALRALVENRFGEED